MLAIPSRGRLLDAAFAALAAAQLAGAAVLVPRGDGLALPDGRPLGAACLSHTLLGVDCPLCGMTRSFVAIAHGQLDRALAFHPGGPILFLATVATLIAVVITAARRARPLTERPRFLLALESIALACVALGIIKLVRS